MEQYNHVLLQVEDEVAAGQKEKIDKRKPKSGKTEAELIVQQEAMLNRSRINQGL